MTYTNELAAAQNRGMTLERELGNARQQLAAQHDDAQRDGWGVLMHRGVNVEMRESATSRRKKIKSRARIERKGVRRKRARLRADRRSLFYDRRRYLRSLTAWGPVASCLFPALLMMVWLVLAEALMPHFSTRGYLAFVLAASVGPWALANLWCQFLAAREATRAADLPFALKGHHERLASQSPSVRDNKMNIKMTIDFAGASPNKSQVRRLLKGLAGKTRGARWTDIRSTEVTQASGQLVLKPETLVTCWVRGNRGYLLWYRRVVEQALIELHGVYPIAQVSISLK